MVPPIRKGEGRRLFTEGLKCDKCHQLHVNLSIEFGTLRGASKCIFGHLVFLLWNFRSLGAWEK